ncbi:hypothetical protein QQX98_011560 [Neonectria punicea]|uniref:Lumazine-binding protein n=1 Tax=Neonectria punicea TaxID=979145 RepID=A0ABR1GLE6_9HYPO
MSKNIKTIPTAEYQAVIDVIEKFYVGSGLTGDKALLDQAFHKDNVIYSYSPDGSLSAGSYTKLYAYFDQFGAAPNMKTRADILSITPTTAIVKLDMEGAADGATYTNFHTLMKLDGEWKIIAKTFHTYAS